MKRLTKQWGKDNENCVAIELDYLLLDLRDNEFFALERIIRKLAYYEDLEDSERLFTTPYRLNDSVYIIGDNDEIKETSIDGFQIRKLNGGFELCILTPIYDDIRQTGYNVMAEDGVFLTRGEAELKLKEME